MGDCIMAFWNAPVLDPMHAETAVQAARAMATSVDEINAENTAFAEGSTLDYLF